MLYGTENTVFSYNLMNFDKKIVLEHENSFDDFVVNNNGVLIQSGDAIIEKKYNYQ